MNELLQVYLDADQNQLEIIISQIDNLLIKYGWRYLGFENFYGPVEAHDRDDTIVRACNALRHASWLKLFHPFTVIGNEIRVCDIDKLCTEHMVKPSEERYKYYENYYLKTNELPHAIIVDENRNLVDGYISYLLAKKYTVHPDIMEKWSDQPIRKIVLGRHVRKVIDGYQIKCNKVFVWIYNIKDPVVKGDLLQVHTRKGLDYIVVDSVSYVTGNEQCFKYNKVKSHMRINVKDEIIKE